MKLPKEVDARSHRLQVRTLTRRVTRQSTNETVALHDTRTDDRGLQVRVREDYRKQREGRLSVAAFPALTIQLGVDVSMFPDSPLPGHARRPRMGAAGARLLLID